MQDIKNSVALVTGASRGIGRAIAKDLAKAGVNVAINYIGSEQKAQEALSECQKYGVKAITIKADVSKVNQIQDMCKKVKAELGPIQILVNNAGIAKKKPITEITEEDWDSVVETNLKSAFFASQAVVPDMKDKGWGRIINISSVAAQTGGVIGPNYAASKAGMIGLSHSLASLLVKDGITCNNLAPALVETEMLQGSPDVIPVGRFGKPDEVADFVVALAKNGYTTGQTISINGGWYFT